MPSPTPSPKISNAKASVSCSMVQPSSDEKQSIYQLQSVDGQTLHRTFTEFERFFDRMRIKLVLDVERPPKKKFLVTDSKLASKRRAWVEAFVNQLISKYADNYSVQEFLGPLVQGGNDENFVYLGPSEKKSTKPTDFDYLKTIGQGSFGRVFMVRHQAEGKIYAMKVLGKEHIKRRNEVKHVMAERNVLLANIHHPFLVSLHYSFQTKDKLYFVLDFLNGGELFFHLQKERFFSEPRARFYAAEIASALGYLHQNSIIYRDLKPENLLLDKHGHVVLTDFGLCKQGIKHRDMTHTFCGTPEYLAPEIIRKSPYDSTVDWWCLGCVLYEMLFGLPPFYSKNQKEMYEMTLNQPLSVPSDASMAARTVLHALLDKDRTRRLGARADFAEIRDHPFFLPIDWAKLLRRELKTPFVPKVRNETDTHNISKEFVDVEPNPASLAPPSNTYIDNEFTGFTYNYRQIETKQL